MFEDLFSTDDQQGGSQGNGKVLLVPLTQKKLLTTRGSTTAIKTYVELGKLARILPFAESLKVHWEGEGFTTNFQAEVSGEWSVTGTTWSPVFSLLGAQTADGQTLSARFTDDTKFGPLWRVAVECQNQSGTAVESGIVTVLLEIELKS